MKTFLKLFVPIVTFWVSFIAMTHVAGTPTNSFAETWYAITSIALWLSSIVGLVILLIKIYTPDEKTY